MVEQEEKIQSWKFSMLAQEKAKKQKAKAKKVKSKPTLTHRFIQKVGKRKPSKTGIGAKLRKVGAGMTLKEQEKLMKQQLRLKKLRKQLQPKLSAGERQEYAELGVKLLPEFSQDNIHEIRMAQEQQKVDRYEKHLRKSQVPRDFFLRKRALAQRKILLQREFARRNNLLARQVDLPQGNLDFLNVDEENNILRSENIMEPKENSINILHPRNSILSTRESGNNLRFF